MNDLRLKALVNGRLLIVNTLHSKLVVPQSSLAHGLYRYCVGLKYNSK